jgi:hypothetical protein
MESRRPWSPDPAWADPLIATLALLCLLGCSLVLRQRSAPPAPGRGPSVQGRVLELALGARLALGPQARAGALVAQELPSASDRAIAAVFAAEEGRMDEARGLLEAEPRPSEAFRRTFQAAYAGGAPQPPSVALHDDLGDGLALRLLEARLRPADERDTARRAALEGWTRRFALLAAAGLLATLLLLGGLSTGLWLLVSKAPWPAMPAWQMPGRALLLVLLGWFTAYFLSAMVAQLFAALWPAMRPYALPLGYALHAATGLVLLARAEGLDARGLSRRLFPGPGPKSLVLAPAFVGLGFCIVLAVAVALAPLLRGRAHPQQELFENLRQIQGIGPVAAMFLTVAVLAPCFEETMMRGLLMGWLRSRRGPALALAVSALVFGAIHLQVLALPTLSLLGAAFGLGVLRSGDLRTSIVAHGLWNGGLFLLMRLLV